MFHGLATLLSQPSPTSTVSRSTLSINKERRPPLPQQPPQAPNQQQPQQHQQPQAQAAFQERLVDWDRPVVSVGATNRMNSNSSPSLVTEMAATTAAPLQNRVVTLRSNNSKSVPALHSDLSPGQVRLWILFCFLKIIIIKWRWWLRWRNVHGKIAN